SYQEERVKVGRRLLQADALLTSLASMHRPLATASRDRVASCLMQIPRMHQLIARETAGLRISYHRGPLVFDYRGKNVPSDASAVQVGDRAPNGLLFSGRQVPSRQLYDLLTGSGHTLLIFASQRGEERRREVQSVLASWSEFLEVIPIRRFSPPSEGEPPSD